MQSSQRRRRTLWRGAILGVVFGLIAPALWLVVYELTRPRGWPYDMGYQYIMAVAMLQFTVPFGLIGGLVGSGAGVNARRPIMAEIIGALLGAGLPPLLYLSA